MQTTKIKEVIFVKYIVDRIEGNIAVLEDDDKETINVLIDILPEGIKEGTILEHIKDKFIIDKKSTNRRKEKFDKMMDDLFE